MDRPLKSHASCLFCWTTSQEIEGLRERPTRSHASCLLAWTTQDIEGLQDSPQKFQGWCRLAWMNSAGVLGQHIKVPGCGMWVCLEGHAWGLEDNRP